MSEKRHSILLIDDDPIALKVLSVQLRAFGLRSLGSPDLLTSESAQSALALLESGHAGIVLILCDLQMPGMDGVEFVRHLVRLNYQGGLVLVSGENKRVLQTAERLAMAHGLRVLGAFQKPVARDQLQTVLAAVLPAVATENPGDEVPCSAEELQDAMERGQLVNFYQPKVELLSEEVAGVEALVGWRHPVFGLILPEAFMGLAKSYGLMDKVAGVALKEAVRQAGGWRTAGFQIELAVNVSMSHLSSLDFPDVLEQMARDAGIPLNSLTLEVTGAEVLANPQSQLDVMARLRLKGVRLAIDDFGIGTSALAQLRDSPIDEIKIDCRIVRQSRRDATRQTVLQASFRSGRESGMKTVGTGVEDRLDWDSLLHFGCDYAQGNFIAKPMLAEDFQDWHCRWRSRLEEKVN